ncbi:unnamed protein product, partial [Gulo gulo]
PLPRLEPRVERPLAPASPCPLTPPAWLPPRPAVPGKSGTGAPSPALASGRDSGGPPQDSCQSGTPFPVSPTVSAATLAFDDTTLLPVSS